MGSRPKARAGWPPRRPSDSISMRLPPSFGRVTWRIKPGNVCWLLGSHQAVDQSLLALFGQVLPLLPIFLTALQQWGAVLRHAGQRLKRGQRLQCNRKKKKPDGIFPTDSKTEHSAPRQWGNLWTDTGVTEVKLAGLPRITGCRWRR